MVAAGWSNEILTGASIVIALVVAAISGYFALKGKKLDAGAWITESLRADAMENREEVREIMAEFEEFKKQSKKEKEKAEKERAENLEELRLMRIAIASLKIREKELIAYVTLVEKEVQILRDLLIAQGAATPESDLTIETLNVLDAKTISFVEDLMERHQKEDDDKREEDE